MTEQRITDLEIHLMHQEDTIQQLNEVVYQQQQQLDRLSAEVELLKQQLQCMAPSTVREPADEEPPPHY
ncbi:SlyX family protein [Geobacter sp. AOG1]|uniref:SlyX family protein n=1 Tax=Geobacter sp. AOG1 TaxID=1566346 RepID=UPI001CC747E8|nr:SlyX family protein [Geobacter sp. AOG1]GFE58053.1 hypothetical protein AOG1_19330 [Geobacter sp. AOG1]